MRRDACDLFSRDDALFAKFSDNAEHNAGYGIGIDGRGNRASADRFVCEPFRGEQALQLIAEPIELQLLVRGLRLPSIARFETAQSQSGSHALGKFGGEQHRIE